MAAIESVPRPPILDDDWLNPGPTAEAAGVVKAHVEPWYWWIIVVLATLAYAFGWLAGAVLIPVIGAGKWVFAAVALGWEDASDDWRKDGRH
jgi:hypothetical protein